MKPVVVITTYDDLDAARKCAGLLVERRLAACVQIGSPVESTYRWEDKVVSDQEFVLTIKSSEDLFEELCTLIKQNHSYDVPEIIAVEISNIDQPYLKWMTEELK